MKKQDQCEHRLECGTCIKTGKICPHLPAENSQIKSTPCVEPLPDVDWVGTISNDSIPDCCKPCPNHPSNGGSGICNCVLPYMSLSSTGRSINKGDGGTYIVDSSQKYNGNDTVTIPYKDSQTEYDPNIPHTYTSTNE